MRRFIKFLYHALIGLLLTANCFSAERVTTPANAKATAQRMKSSSVNLLLNQLQLVRDQANAVERILEREAEEIAAILEISELTQDEVDQQVLEVREKNAIEISTILSPEQKTRFERLISEIKQRKAEIKKHLATKNISDPE